MNVTNTTTSFKLSSYLRTFTFIGPAFVVVWSLLILIGWWLNIAWLKNPFPDRIPAAPSAVFLLILCSFAIVLLHQSVRFSGLIVCRLLAFLVVASACAVFGHYLGSAFDPDQLLFAQPLAQFEVGRMTTLAAVKFILLGSAIVLFTSKRKWCQLAAQSFILVVLLISFTTLTGYVYDRSMDFAAVPMVPPALWVAVMFAMLSIAILSMHKELRPVSLYLSEAQGGKLFRITLPFALLTPLVCGWIRIVGQNAELFNAAVGVSAMVAFETVVLVCVAYFASIAADKTDIRRIAAEAELKKRKLLLEAILNSLAEGVIVADTKGAFLSSNSAATALTGIEAKDQAPETWAQEWGWYMPDGITPFQVMNLPLVRAMRGESVEGMEVFIRNKFKPSGGMVSLSASPLKSDSSGYSGGVMIVRDISQNKDYGRELRKSKVLSQKLSRKRQAKGGRRRRRR